MYISKLPGLQRDYLIYLVIICVLVFGILTVRFSNTVDDNKIPKRFPKDYTFLPAAYIYKDIRNLKWFDQLAEKYETGDPDEYFYEDKSKLRLLRFSPGNAIMYLPPFLVAHYFSLANNLEASGYSSIYLRTLLFWKISLVIIGLCLCYLFLSSYFQPSSAFITCIVFLFTTSLLDASQSESWFPYHQFLLSALFLISIDSFRKRPSKMNCIILGGVVFLLTIMDLNNTIFFAFIFLWFISPKPHHVKSKIFHVIKNYKYYVIPLLGLLSGLMMHLVYTHHMLKSFEFYNYDGRIFGYFTSNFVDSWINIGYGLLLYSPVLMLLIPGFYFLHSLHKRLFYFALIAVLGYQVLINLSNVASFSKDFGNNYLLIVFPMMMIPFTAFIQKIFFRPWFTLSILIFIGLNGYYTNWLIFNKQNGNFIPSNEMTPEYFFNVIGREDLSPETIKLLDTEIIYNKPILDSLVLINDHLQYCLDKKIQYTRRWESQIESGKYKYVRFKLEAFHKTKLAEVWNYAQMLISLYENDNNIKNEMIRVQRFTTNDEWKSVWIDAIIPAEANKISASIWNAENKEKICFRKIKVYVYK